MENKKEHCDALTSRWKELKERLPFTQDLRPAGYIIPGKITPVEMIELKNIEQELRENCLEFLSDEDRWEIDTK
ncbi:MAG: hypothetical protein Q8N59_01220 [bacterium]|nr:hypothetical protein [bacterium]